MVWSPPKRRDDIDDDGSRVLLMTIHAAKGLEFRTVFVVGMEEGIFPDRRCLDGDQLEEERRLAYVAITRAMQTLTLSHCGGRKKYGQVLPCHPSPFLKELPPELVELASEKGKAPVTAESGKDYFSALRAALE